MVSFKSLLLGFGCIVAVLGQDPTGDEAAADAFWSSADLSTAGAGDPPEKRGLLLRSDMRDPYWGSYCRAPYTEPPCETKCNRNNCFRGFLNARDGSDGKHCPKEAFAFCCIWNHVNYFHKWIAVKKGYLVKIAPYAKNCKNDGDSVAAVVDKVNDVCGCTLNHEVTIDKTSDYYGLRYYPPYSPKCH
jgi:hypothetical protein